MTHEAQYLCRCAPCGSSAAIRHPPSAAREHLTLLHAPRNPQHLMPAPSTVNTNNPAVKRILREAREISEAGPNVDFDAAPLDDNLFEWHFTIRGPRSTPFEGGRYHGRISLPPEYPFKPPSIALLNASGRFAVGEKICLSVSAHHPEHWQPAWGIRTIITALIAFFPTAAEGALAGLDYTNAERKQLAMQSCHWKCARCGFAMADALPEDDGAQEGASSLPPVPAGLTFAREAPAAVASPCSSAADVAAAESSDGGIASPAKGAVSAVSQLSPQSQPGQLPQQARPIATVSSAAVTTTASAGSTTITTADPTSIAVRDGGGSDVVAPQAPTTADWLGVAAACLVSLIAALISNKLLREV